jgi:hypothetical protein
MSFTHALSGAVRPATVALALQTLDMKVSGESCSYACFDLKTDVFLVFAPLQEWCPARPSMAQAY